MKSRCAAYIQIFVPLIMGTMIYVLFRPPVGIFQKLLPWKDAILSLNGIPSFARNFLLYHTSDIVWAFSFAASLLALTKSRFLSLSLPLCFAVLFEMLQKFEIIGGTADILDIAFSICALFLFYILNFNRRYNDEGKN